MFKPMLRIPKQEALTETYQGVTPDEISVQNWLNQRDKYDRSAFIEAFRQLNRVQCSPAERMAIMNILEPELSEELKALSDKTDKISFPIAAEHLAMIDEFQVLLLEASVAYQIIVNDIASSDSYTEKYLGSLLPEAIYAAIKYLSHLLVERFQFYFSEPKYTWQELNQLYLLAERIGVHDAVIDDKSSTKDKYLQIAILKLLNPYRLMRLESRKIYHLLRNWVEHCEIVGYSQHHTENQFVVNLLEDESPHYYDENRDVRTEYSQSFEGRIITMEKLRVYIDEYLTRVEQEKEHQIFSYQSRMHTEMLRRIDNDLIHEERREERQLAGNQIKLVSGLRACHHFIYERKNFDPQTEIDAQAKAKIDAAAKSDDSEMNLINLLEEERLLNKKNPMGELQSINPFMDETDVIGDEWNRIYASSVVDANLRQSQLQITKNLKEEVWKQKNESKNGMLLVARNDKEMPISVGTLVAYRLNVEKVFCLAYVKWLRINPLKGVAIGIQLIAVQSRAIGVKGVKGIGAGSQFNRAFLISENDTRGKGGKLQLLLPAGIYDKGSILKVWHNQKLHEVEITDVLVVTDSFEQVAFKVIKKQKKQVKRSA
jgi:hypothetical protein